MAIRTPHWLPAGTVPTTKGWMTPDGEVVKKQKFTGAEIAEWHQAHSTAPEPVLQTLHEAPVIETRIDAELEQHYYGDHEDQINNEV